VISNPNGTMTRYYEPYDPLDKPISVVKSIFRTPQFSSLADRYQDDGFGNGIDTGHHLNTEAILFHLFEDLH